MAVLRGLHGEARIRIGAAQEARNVAVRSDADCLHHGCSNDGNTWYGIPFPSFLSPIK